MQKFMADMPFFVEVARRKSFTISAEVLGVPVATLSRRITAMEKKLGIQLFHRTTRRVELTEEGESLYKQCELVVEEVQGIKETILHEQKNPSGRVRLCLPASAYILYLQGHLSAFSALWPNIDLYVHIGRQWMDFGAEAFDLEIRYGRQPDSSFKIHKLGTLYSGLYAAPKFLERHGVPRVPQDLRDLPRVQQNATANVMKLYKETKAETIALPPPKHIVNNPALAEELIITGQVFGPIFNPIARRIEADGLLVKLLPEWSLKGVDIFLIMPPGNMPRRVRLLADYLIDIFKNL